MIQIILSRLLLIKFINKLIKQGFLIERLITAITKFLIDSEYLSSYWAMTMGSTTGTTSGAGTAYPSKVAGFTPGILVGLCVALF